MPRYAQILRYLVLDLVHDHGISPLVVLRTLTIHEKSLVRYLSLFLNLLESSLHAIYYRLLVIGHWLHPLLDFLVIKLESRAVVCRRAIETFLVTPV